MKQKNTMCLKIISAVFLSFLLIGLANGRGNYMSYEEMDNIDKKESPTPFKTLIKSHVTKYREVLSNLFSYNKGLSAENAGIKGNKTITNNLNSKPEYNLDSKGTIIHYALRKGMSRSNSLGNKNFELKLIDPLTREGSVIEFNGKILKMGSGSRRFVDGFLIYKTRNRKINWTLESEIEIIYIGEQKNSSINSSNFKIDSECSHIQCYEGNLHWFNCDGSHWGIIQECDRCQDYECRPKGSLTREVKQDPNIIARREKERMIANGEIPECISINGSEVNEGCFE
jgi:hypothetical protein